MSNLDNNGIYEICRKEVGEILHKVMIEEFIADNEAAKQDYCVLHAKLQSCITWYIMSNYVLCDARAKELKKKEGI